MGGHLAVVNLLQRRTKASVNCKDQGGNTPLWWSTLGCHDKVAKRLLTEDDVDVNVVGGAEDTTNLLLHSTT
jgi:ankyrin repeat protein